MGAGSVTKNPKSGAWYGRCDAPRNTDGSRRQLRVRAETERECWRKLRAALACAEDGTLPAREIEKLTVNNLLDTWLETKRGKAFRTRESYESVTRLHLRPILGTMRVRAVRRSDVEKAIVVWQTGPRADGKPGRRGNTAVRQCITYLFGAFKLAKDDGIRPDNPVESIKKPPAQKGKKPFVLAEGALRILEAIEGTTYHAPVFAAFVLGLRPSELLALRRGDVLLDRCAVDVASTLEARGKHLERKEPKTEKSKRELPIGDVTLGVLQAALGRQACRLARLGVEVMPGTPLFDDGEGEIWHPEDFRKGFRRRIVAADLPPFQWKSTRHSFASIGVELRVHTKVLAEMLGHEDDKITAQIYEQVHRSSMLEANQVIAERLASRAPIA